MMVYSSAHRSMASQSPAKGSSARPSVPRTQTSQSVAPDDDDRLQLPKRAHTFAHPADVADSPDAFETSDHTDTEDALEVTRASIELDILPIELVTLTDRYPAKLLDVLLSLPNHH